MKKMLVNSEVKFNLLLCDQMFSEIGQIWAKYATGAKSANWQKTQNQIKNELKFHQFGTTSCLQRG
jgi:hypothetical protein